MGRRVLSNGSICTLQKSTDFKKVCSKALLPHLQTIPRGRFFIMGLVFPSLLSLSIRSPRSPDCPRSPRKRRQPSPSPPPPHHFSALTLCSFLSPPLDVFAIGDPNQSTLLAVSVAGGVVLLVFLVTCFVVSGRYGQTLHVFTRVEAVGYRTGTRRSEQGAQATSFMKEDAS